MIFTVQGYFGEFSSFLLFMSAQVIVSAQNPLNITLHDNCCSSASVRATKVPKVAFKDNGQRYLFHIKYIF